MATHHFGGYTWCIVVYVKIVNQKSHYDNIISYRTKCFVTNMECISLVADVFSFWNIFSQPR